LRTGFSFLRISRGAACDGQRNNDHLNDGSHPGLSRSLRLQRERPAALTRKRVLPLAAGEFVPLRDLLIGAKYLFLTGNYSGRELQSARGNEAAWWKDAGIDPARASRKRWNESRMNRGGSVWTDVATSHGRAAFPAIILDLSIPGSPGEPKLPWQRRTNVWRKATSPAQGQGG
jgi:hypothetical protein